MKAFPSPYGDKIKEGMDLRDYFAANALRTAFAMAKHDYDRELPKGYGFGEPEDYEELAGRAYALADAMMEMRNGDTGK